MNLTSGEAMRAFEMCSSGSCNTADCPIFREMGDDEDCSTVLSKLAFDLIERKDMVVDDLQHLNVSCKSRISELEEELDLYKRVVGKLRVNEDRTVTGILVGKEVEYIPKDLHEIFKSMTVSSAKSEARKELVERLKKKAEIVSGGDYGFTYEIGEDEIDNLLAEMERGDSNNES